MSLGSVINDDRLMSLIAIEFSPYDQFVSLYREFGIVDDIKYIYREHNKVYILIRLWSRYAYKTFEDFRDILRRLKKYKLISAIEPHIDIKITPSFTKSELLELQDNIYELLTGNDICEILYDNGVEDFIIDEIMEHGDPKAFWGALDLYSQLYNGTVINTKLFEKYPDVVDLFKRIGIM